MVVRIVDTESRRIVRELGGFQGRVLDIVSHKLGTSCFFLIITSDILIGFTLADNDVA